MQLLATGLLATALGLMAFAPAPLPRPPKKVPKKAMVTLADLDGRWVEVARKQWTPTGVVVSKGTLIYEVEIKNGKWKRLRAGKGAAKLGAEYEVHLDPGQKPTWLDLKRTTGTPYQTGVVELQGDTLRFCYVTRLSKLPRPGMVEPQQERQIQVILERKKP